MNKFLGIFFLAILLILTQNKVATYANASPTDSSTPSLTSNTKHLDDDSDDKDEISQQTNHKYEDDKDDEDETSENDDDKDDQRRIIAIIPNSSNSALLKHKPTTHASPTVTPTPTPDATVSSTLRQETKINLDHSEDKTTSARFDFIKELEKLLASLKKIIFTTIS